MGLALFVYGEQHDLNFEVEKVDNEADALCHLGTCIENVHHTFENPCAIFGTHFEITQNEFDEWERSGNWSPKLTALLREQFTEYKKNVRRLAPEELEDLPEYED